MESGKEIADKVLTAIRVPATVNVQINVQIVSPSADSPEIRFVGNRTLVGLKNNDPFNYPMRWKLQWEGDVIDGGSVALKAASTTYLSADRIWRSSDYCG